MGATLEYNQIVSELLEDQSWIEALRGEGLILDPNEGETIIKLAEGIAKVLTGRNQQT